MTRLHRSATAPALCAELGAGRYRLIAGMTRTNLPAGLNADLATMRANPGEIPRTSVWLVGWLSSLDPAVLASSVAISGDSELHVTPWRLLQSVLVLGEHGLPKKSVV